MIRSGFGDKVDVDGFIRTTIVKFGFGKSSREERAGRITGFGDEVSFLGSSLS